MAEPHPNVVKFTRIVRAFNESDYDTEYTGRNAFAEFLRKAKAETQATITVDVQVRDRKRRSRDNLRRCPRGA